MFNILLNVYINTKVFPVFRIIFVVIIALCAIGLIITTLLQSSTDQNNATALTGQESYFAQNKGESRDGRLKKATIILACIIVVCVLLFFVTWILTPKG